MEKFNSLQRQRAINVKQRKLIASLKKQCFEKAVPGLELIAEVEALKAQLSSKDEVIKKMREVMLLGKVCIGSYRNLKQSQGYDYGVLDEMLKQFTEALSLTQGEGKEKS